MFGCNMTSDVSHVVMSGLSQCRHLENVDLCENTLTGCIGDFLGSTPDAGFHDLKFLRLSCTELNKDDVAHLAQIIAGNNAPNLHDLDLSNKHAH